MSVSKGAVQCIIFAFSCTFLASAGNEIYMSPAGDNSNTGTFASPVRTLEKCCAMAGSGGTCYLRGGRYHVSSSIVLEGLTNVNIFAYDNEIPIIDGTVTVLGGWDLLTSTPFSNVWETRQAQTVWQLFWGEERMHLPPARWPNGAPWSNQGYNRDNGGWRYESLTSTFGNLTDDYQQLPTNESLAETGKSMDGCVAVINNGHWKTMEAIVENHTAGTNSFEYDTLHAGSGKPAARHPGDGKGRYFLEFCPQIIDDFGEWAYNKSTKKILLRSPTNVPDQDPNNNNIYGKNVTYGIVLKSCSSVAVKGLHFFGTTLVMWESTSCKVLNSDFSYPSFSKRALGLVKGNYNPSGAWYNGNKNHLKFTGAAPTAVGSKTSYRTNSTWKNNKFRYTDNAALSFSNSGLDTVYNNHFNHIDYSGVGYSFTILTNTKTGPITFSRNTIDTAGASAGLNTPGSIETHKNDFFKYCLMENGNPASNPTSMAFEEFTGECRQRPLAEYNYFTNMGLVQHDGAALQASSLVQRGTIYAYNWVVNTRKLGLRFDSGDDCIYGDNGTMHHNVVMGALGAIKSKGNDHMFYNNLVFDSWQSEDLQILRYYPSDKSCQPIGNATVVMNNAGGTISGKATGYLDITPYAKYESQYNYNEFVNTPKVRNLLRDYKNYDFRPRQDSTQLIDRGKSVSYHTNSDIRIIGSTTDIGAYEYGDTYYFIPGYQDTFPTFPIPPDNSTTAKYDADLMFLGARNAVRHELEIYNPSSNTFELKQVFHNDDNIFSNCTWERNSFIRWRVRAIFEDGSSSISSTWKFLVPLEEDVTLSINPTDDAAVYDAPSSKQNDNFGNKIKLRVRDELGDGRITSYLRFSLDSEATSAIKDSDCDVVVSNASLEMQVYTQSSIAELSLWSMNDTTWDEMVITGLNHPNGWLKRLQSKTNLNVSSIVRFDIKDYISGLHANNTNVFTLGLTSTQDKQNLILYSKESSGVLKPTLKISYATSNCAPRVCKSRNVSSVNSDTSTTQTTTEQPTTTQHTTTEMPTTGVTTTTIETTTGQPTTTQHTTTYAPTTTSIMTTTVLLNSTTSTAHMSSTTKPYATTSPVPYSTTTNIVDVSTTTPGVTTTHLRTTSREACCNLLTAICRACQLGVSIVEFCENNIQYNGCDSYRTTTENPNARSKGCCKDDSASCNSCTLGISIGEYCAKEANKEVDGCESKKTFGTEIIVLIIVGSSITCLCLLYVFKTFVFDPNMRSSRRSGRELQMTRSGNVIELGTRRFSIRTPTGNPAHAVGFIHNDERP